MDDVSSGSSNGSSIIVTAQYKSTRAGKKKIVSLIDAVTPLLGPPTHQLLLSSRPIDVPWPLAVGDVTDSVVDKERHTKRQRVDDVGLQIEQLQDVLAIEIPEALLQLQACLLDREEDWLTLSSAEMILTLRESVAKEDFDIPCVELELGEESRKDLNSIEVEAEKMLSVDTGANFESRHLVHRLFANDGNCDAIIDIQVKEDKATKVCMPPRSAFLLTNILRSQMDLPRGWQRLLDLADAHPPNLILLDPPYPNYSAKRLKTKQETYEPVEDLYDLWKLKLPVQKLLDRRNKKEGVLIGCWVTNNAKVHRFILTKLFPAWGLHHIGQLVWIKVTTKGELIFPINNKQGRKPYEILLLAHSNPNYLSFEVQTKLFASVPLGHSRKPAVFDVLRPFLCSSKEVNVYEFFARTLFPGPSPKGSWVSIGNEPFRFSQEGVGWSSLIEK